MRRLRTIKEKRAGGCGLTIEALPGVVLVTGVNGRVQTASAEARRLLGDAVARDGLSLCGLLHPQDIDFLEARAFDTGQGGRIIRLRGAAGAFLTFRAFSADRGALDGHPGRVINLHPVREDAGAVSKLHAVVEGAAEGLIVHRGGAPLFSNMALAEMLGFDSLEEVLAEPSILPYIHEADREKVIANISARLEGRAAPRSYEFRMRHRSGEVFWVDCRSSVVEWDGAPAVLAACFDITDRKRAEAARESSERLLARVFEASPNFILLSRLEDDTLIEVNMRFLTSFGLTRPEVIGKGVFDLDIWVHEDDKRRLSAALKDEGVIQDMEVTLRSAGGSEIEVLVSSEIIECDGDQVLLVIGQDIGDRKAYEEELRASKEAADLANRSKSEFLANMSHELRTPLNAILGFSEIIKDQILGRLEEPKYAEYARDIHESGSHLLEIINDILDLSKIEAGRLEVHTHDVCVPELVHSCIRLIEPRAEDAGLALDVDVPADAPTLRADERLMKQILLNLLSNAVKFTPRGGRVGVRVERTGEGGLRLSVRDTGIGMDEDGVESALRPFGQVDTSFSRKHQGSGLGLPLVVAFSERQGACFDLDTALGEGTEIAVTFPADRVVGGALRPAVPMKRRSEASA